MKNLGSLILGLIIGAGVMYFYCCNQGGVDVVSPMVKPRGIITPAQAKVLDTTFNSRHKLISDQIVKRPDNRSSWWSLDDITNYLDYAKNQTDSLGYTMNGVRVYLGAYPEVRGQVGYTTMFFVPTGYKTLPEGSSGFAPPGNFDVPGGSGLNMGNGGNPPNSNYPQ